MPGTDIAVHAPAPPPAPRLLSVLIPVYNERGLLRRCVERVLAAPLPDDMRRELVLVDDASTDGTRELVADIAARHPDRVRAFYQEKNRGKGAAIQRAIGEMRGEVAVFQDADLEYDPAEYAALLEPILRDGADVVYGSRFAGGPRRRVLDFHHELGNRFLTLVSNCFTGLNLTDMETCYKVFRADLLRSIPIRSSRFGIEPEITAKIAKRRVVVYEVPISYHGRGYAEGKKIGVKDGISALWTIFKYRILDDCFDERLDNALLHSLARARAYAQWQARAFFPYMGERILEIGSGIGQISRLLPKRGHLTVSDRDEAFLDELVVAFAGNELVTVARCDPENDADFPPLAALEHDTVVCLNVLEKIEDDLAALRRMRSLLPVGGRLLLLTAQHPKLYGTLDEAAGHKRRYTRPELRGKLAEAGFAVQVCRGFNGFTPPGWWLKSVALKRRDYGRVSLKIFNTLVPLLGPLDRINPLPGQSIFCVAEAI